MKLYSSWKIKKKSNLIKICPEEVKLFHVDSQMDRQPDNQLFANVTKNGLCQDLRFSKQ